MLSRSFRMQPLLSVYSITLCAPNQWSRTFASSKSKSVWASATTSNFNAALTFLLFLLSCFLQDFYSWTAIMRLPDIESMTIHDSALPTIPDDIDHASDRYMQKLKNYAKNLPYSIEPNSKMQELLDFILRRITQCVEAKDYDPGLLQWDILFT